MRILRHEVLLPGSAYNTGERDVRFAPSPSYHYCDHLMTM
jgi:hypothetical protein